MTRPIFAGLKLHGIVLDLDPVDVIGDRWTAGRNVYFLNGETRRVTGINQIFAGELFDCEAIHYFDIGQEEWWIYCSGEGVGVTDGVGNHYNITPAGWAPIATKNFCFSIGDLNGLPFVNHPEIGPFWWDGDPGHVMTKLPDWPAAWSCQVMRAHKNFLFAMAIDTGAGLLEGQLSWSSSADPGQVPEFWAPTPTNDAGDVTFATPTGALVGGVSVRDQFFVSKNGATYALQYVGGQYVFQARDVFPSVGLYGPNAIVEADNFVYMLTGAGRFIRHDGNSVQSLLYGIAEEYLARTMNQEWTALPFCYQADEGNIVALAYPTGAARACTEAIGIEIASIGRDGPLDMGLRDLPGVYGWALGYTEIVPASWNGDPAPWDSDLTIWNEQASGYRPPQVVFACGVRGFGQLDKGSDVFGVAIEAYAERLGMEMGDFENHKVVSGAFPRLQGNAGDVVWYRFGGQDQVRQPVVWGAELPYTVGTTHQLDFFQDGRLLAHALRSSGGTAWRSNGVQLLARRAGRW